MEMSPPEGECQEIQRCRQEAGLTSEHADFEATGLWEPCLPGNQKTKLDL